MIKKTINFVDFDGVDRTGDYYFHLSEADLAEMELSTQGGMEAKLKAMVASQDGKAIINTIKEILAAAYGERTENGGFRKSEKLSEQFFASGAYSVLFMELVTDPDATVKFIKGVLPEKLSKQMEKNLKEDGVAKKASSHTMDELLAMTQEEFDAVAGTSPEKMTREHLIIATKRKMASK